MWPEVQTSNFCKHTLRRFPSIFNLHLAFPYSFLCEQRTPVAVLLFNLKECEERVRHRINSGGIHWRYRCLGLQMGHGAAGSYRLLLGILFLLPGNVRELKWGLPGSCADTHAQMNTSSERPEVC